jgi:hypothetical protein
VLEKVTKNIIKYDIIRLTNEGGGATIFATISGVPLMARKPQ